MSIDHAFPSLSSSNHIELVRHDRVMLFLSPHGWDFIKKAWNGLMQSTRYRLSNLQVVVTEKEGSRLFEAVVGAWVDVWSPTVLSPDKGSISSSHLPGFLPGFFLCHTSAVLALHLVCTQFYPLR